MLFSNQSNVYESFAYSFMYLVSGGQRQYPKIENFQISQCWINLSVFSAIFSIKSKANTNKFGIFLKEKNRFIFYNSKLLKWRSKIFSSPRIEPHTCSSLGFSSILGGEKLLDLHFKSFEL